MTTNCKNCNHNFEGEFCPICGQTIHTHEINFTSIIHEIQHSLLHIDKGILYTTKELFSRPGHTIKEYINGKRVKHFKPIAYILVLSTIYTLLTNVTHQSSYFDKMLQGATNGSKGGSNHSLDLFVELLKWLANHYAYATLIFIPLASLASYLAFFRAKYNYFQHIILNAFVAGQKTVIFLVMLPITYIFNNQNLTDTIDVLTLLAGIILSFWSYFQFFNSTKPYKRILLIIWAYVLNLLLILGLLITLAKISKMMN